MICKLCESHFCKEISGPIKRSYIQCETCGLIFVPENFWLSSNEELTRYSLHDNSINNVDYIKYLNQTVTKLLKITTAGCKVLDFGSGKDRVLESLLGKHGIECISYDPLFFASNKLQNCQFDIIVINEVIEHIKNLKDDIIQIRNCLKDTGTVLLRTKTYSKVTDFKSWWYLFDPTHINFFTEITLKYVRDNFFEKFSLTIEDDFIWISS